MRAPVALLPRPTPVGSNRHGRAARRPAALHAAGVDVAPARHGRSAPRAGRRGRQHEPAGRGHGAAAGLAAAAGARRQRTEARGGGDNAAISRVHDGRRVQLRHVPDPPAARRPVSVSDRPPAVPRRAARGDGGGPAAAAQSARNRSPSARCRAAATGDQRHRARRARGRVVVAPRPLAEPVHHRGTDRPLRSRRRPAARCGARARGAKSAAALSSSRPCPIRGSG